MKCPDCDVTWSEYAPEAGRVCWSCGREIPKPETKAKPAYVFPP